MSRPLVPGLLAEGKTDELFLSTVIFRHLRGLTERVSRHVVDVAKTEIGDCRTICDLETVTHAALELAEDCHLICVHNDHNERGKAERVAASFADHGCVMPVIPLVPVRETEAWLLADPAVWASLRGSNVSVLPKNPKDVEKRVPKAVLDAVLPPRGSRTRDDYFGYLGQNVDLAVLARLPAYAAWAGETEKALKGLKYL